MRAVVLAYHEIGYVCLEELLASKIEVAALFTHKDDPTEEIWFRTPRGLAEKHGIPVYDPESAASAEWLDRIKEYAPDYLFSFYYRNMLPQEVLDIPKIAAMNLHGSLLPRFRGRCPVNWVLIEGEGRTGVTLHIMEKKPDAGAIVAQEEVEIAFEDTAHTLALKLAAAAARLMRGVMPLLESGTFASRPQEGPSSYYGGRKPEDGIIDWTKNAVAVYNLVRAVTHPYPGAFTCLNGRKLLIWKALPQEGTADGHAGLVVSTDPLLVKCGQGLLRLDSVELEGEEETDGPAFAIAHSLYRKSLGGRM
ncbi:MAG: formyltransferase [Syntrophorhabdales bacterium]